ncbi:hypothetical protein [Nocardioides pelophilus]|uniref:hypothetical protein n=1 Tax=Nocardioides pelophilus TaxID=2172019 RepID=UPI0016016510|nr:hypothetical protein [Nocardioides pelophilus]
MDIALVVALVVVGGASIIATIVVAIWAFRRHAQNAGADVRASFPDAVVGPELGQYRGGTGSFPSTRNTSWIVLTPHALAVRPLLGKAISLPVADVTGTRMQRGFKGQWNGQPVLVVETTRGEIGLTVESPAQWEAALAR